MRPTAVLGLLMLDAADRAALGDLVHCYAALVDDRHFTSAAELFADNAQLTLPDPPSTLEPVKSHSGRAAIADALAAVTAVIRTQHAIVGEVYDADPRSGTARGRVACIAHHWMEHGDELRDVVWHLRYDDEYRRSKAGPWRIHRRALTIDAIETRSARQVRP